ncbi:MAG TPA: hypothetical protein LFW20_01005 [Rickettsia endosymbiont of Omalisus fontisbellaquei]|nr:hypothetical protein [Rickettsia endosymbiont of Omalisus fontisbellaquei]
MKSKENNNQGQWQVTTQIPQIRAIQIRVHEQQLKEQQQAAEREAQKKLKEQQKAAEREAQKKLQKLKEQQQTEAKSKTLKMQAEQEAQKKLYDQQLKELKTANQKKIAQMEANDKLQKQELKKLQVSNQKKIAQMKAQQEAQKRLQEQELQELEAYTKKKIAETVELEKAILASFRDEELRQEKARAIEEMQKAMEPTIVTSVLYKEKMQQQINDIARKMKNFVNQDDVEQITNEVKELIIDKQLTNDRLKFLEKDVDAIIEKQANHGSNISGIGDLIKKLSSDGEEVECILNDLISLLGITETSVG